MADSLSTMSSPREKNGGPWLIGGAAPEKERDISTYLIMV